jgi:hypothetical protein
LEPQDISDHGWDVKVVAVRRINAHIISSSMFLWERNYLMFIAIDDGSNHCLLGYCRLL